MIEYIGLSKGEYTILSTMCENFFFAKKQRNYMNAQLAEILEESPTF